MNRANNFHFPVNLSNFDNNFQWLNKYPYGSLLAKGIPHAGEDWNWGSGYDDYGMPLNVIGNGIVKKI